MLNRLRDRAAALAPSASAGESRAAASTAPIYLIAMAGYPNYGDELIVARWLKFFARHLPNTDVWLDVREPGNASSIFKGMHPRLHVTNTVFRTLFEHQHLGKQHPAEAVRNLGTPLFDLGLLDLREAGTVHLVGGGFINAEWPEQKALVDMMRAVREVSGAKVVATGQGLMPFVGETFADFDYVSVRDTPSAEALGIARGFDDAYLGQHPATPAEAAPGKDDLEVFVCVQNDAVDDGAHQAMVDFARRQLQQWDIPRERVRYVEAIPGNDHAGYAALQDLIAEDGFIPFTRFWRSEFTYAPHQLWLTSRFHHHLMASLHGARGVALSGKAGYYDVKHGSIIESGSNWKLFTRSEAPVHLADLQIPADFTPVVEAKNKEAAEIYL